VPRLNGLPSRIGVQVKDDYVGLLTVNYTLSCKEGGGVTSRNFVMKLYVGIPIPTLADTGVDATGPVALAGALLIAGFVLSRRRRATAR
jgi:LPXTG-motif cell wall-anchored protein